MFSDAMDMQAAEAARRLVIIESTPVEDPSEQLPTPTAPPVERKKPTTGTVATAVMAGAALALAPQIADAVNGPRFSEETKSVVIEDGEGLYDAVGEIQGADTIDPRDAVTHITSDPANIDVLKDGVQPGDSIEVPVEVIK